jgi:hypothetical protein
MKYMFTRQRLILQAMTDRVRAKWKLLAMTWHPERPRIEPGTRDARRSVR